MHWVSGLLLVVALQTAPAKATKDEKVASMPLTAAPAFNTTVCQKKRVDSCGCHHVYGLRHCHPNRMGPHCERLSHASAPRSAELTAALHRD